MKIRFPERGVSGRSVLAIKNLEFGYGDKVSDLFNKMRRRITVLNFLLSDYCVHILLV